MKKQGIFPVKQKKGYFLGADFPMKQGIFSVETRLIASLLLKTRGELHRRPLFTKNVGKVALTNVSH